MDLFSPDCLLNSTKLLRRKHCFSFIISND